MASEQSMTKAITQAVIEATRTAIMALKETVALPNAEDQYTQC